MKNEIIKNQTICDKCEGNGKNFSISAHILFKQWRSSLQVSLTQVAKKLRTDRHSLSKFENGHLRFGEARQRELAKILSSWNTDAEMEKA